MSDENQIVLLLDLADDHPIDEAGVLACVPPAAARVVLRLTGFGASRCSAGTPDNWLPVLSAIERMLRAAGGADHGDVHYWIAGRAGLPAFFYLGHRLGKRAPVTLVGTGRAGAGPLEMLAIDPASPPASPPEPPQPVRPYFERSAWPRRPSPSEVPLGWIVSSQHPVARDEVERVIHRPGPPVVVVEAQAQAALDAATIGSALRELDEQAAGIRAWYPRAAEFSVFLAGSAALAFVVGRSLNPHAFPDALVFQHRPGGHELAYETRSQRRKHIILFMPANPVRTTRNALGEEAHDLQQELARCQYRDRFELQPQLAPHAIDIHRHIEALRPELVHFTGHGEPDGLVFHQDDGSFRAVSADELGEMFRSAAGSVKVAVLSACFTDAHAAALLAHIDCVVGTPGPLPDAAARSFALGFYEALGDRAPVQTAYEIGCLAMDLAWPPRGVPAAGGGGGGSDAAEGAGGDDRPRPRLLVRPGVDARRLVLGADTD